MEPRHFDTPIISEVYITEVSDVFSWVRVYSHIKGGYVHGSSHWSGDILPLFKDFNIAPDNSIIHIQRNHNAFREIERAGYLTKQSMYL